MYFNCSRRGRIVIKIVKDKWFEFKFEKTEEKKIEDFLYLLEKEGYDEDYSEIDCQYCGNTLMLWKNSCGGNVSVRVNLSYL